MKFLLLQNERLTNQTITSSLKLKQNRKCPFSIREVGQGQERDRDLEKYSSHMIERRFPINLPWAIKEKESLLDLIMLQVIFTEGFPSFQSMRR